MVYSNLESHLEQNEAMTRRQRDGVEWPCIHCYGGMTKTQDESCLGGYKPFPSISACILSPCTNINSLIYLKL